MSKRLIDNYLIGERVEITFQQGNWHWGVVVRHDHPGIWVQTADSRQWFVTNSRRIRKVAANE